jgi:hypothetical protein
VVDVRNPAQAGQLDTSLGHPGFHLGHVRRWRTGSQFALSLDGRDLPVGARCGGRGGAHTRELCERWRGRADVSAALRGGLRLRSVARSCRAQVPTRMDVPHSCSAATQRRGSRDDQVCRRCRDTAQASSVLPLWRGRARARIAGRNRRSAALRLLDLPTQRGDCRVGAAIRDSNHPGRGCVAGSTRSTRTWPSTISARDAVSTRTTSDAHTPDQYGFNVGCLEGVNPFDLEPVAAKDGVNHPADRRSG